MRRKILAALARGDGQDLEFFDLDHTAEIMYGRQADAIQGLLLEILDRNTDGEPLTAILFVDDRPLSKSDVIAGQRLAAALGLTP